MWPQSPLCLLFKDGAPPLVEIIQVPAAQTVSQMARVASANER